jgi:hypothetical protein
MLSTIPAPWQESVRHGCKRTCYGRRSATYGSIGAITNSYVQYNFKKSSPIKDGPVPEVLIFKVVTASSVPAPNFHQIEFE